MDQKVKITVQLHSQLVKNERKTYVYLLNLHLLVLEWLMEGQEREDVTQYSLPFREL